MKILINADTIGDQEARRKFVASVYLSLNDLLNGGKLIIEVDPKTPLPQVCSALRNVAGVVDMAADAIAGPPDDDDEEDHDEADFWKR